mmetsp:Transcript_2842/g.5141  ORF Transcript_2842/g.5141 Transcript_2842/m.5141 type:complete len:691 (-) Transcript_2842:236-2308(-)
MEDESSYLASLIAKLYENTTGSFNFTCDTTSDEDFVKVEPGSDKDDNKPNSKKRKVVDDEEEFFKNSSAAIIAESTEKTLKQMNIDPNSKEGKMQRRKIRNRMSAQIHRDRKKAYIDYLEDKVRKRDEVISILQTMLKKNHLEISQLRESLAQVMKEVDNKTDTGASVQMPVPMPMPIISPADSSTSTESAFQHTDGSTGSQSSSSPEIDHDYFSDFDCKPDGNFDPKIFNTDDGMWDAQPYEDLTDLDFDQSLSEDDLMKLPLQGATVGGGGSLSMFSIVMMMSFSFFTGIISMSSVTGGTSSLSLIDSSSQFATSISETWTLNDVKDIESGPPEVDYSYGLLSSAKDTHVAFEDSTEAHPVGHGRVLLSLPSNDDDDDVDTSYKYPNQARHIPSPDSSVKDKKYDYVIKSPTTRLPSTYTKTPATLSSLWHRQNYEFIGNIYPADDSKHIRDTNKTYTGMNNEGRKYLRFRSARGIENGTSSEAKTTAKESTERDANSLHASDKSVTLYTEPKKSGEFSSGGSSETSPLASKVLLSEGRVLLNPLLADLRNVHNNKESSADRSSDYETDRAIIPSLPNRFGHSISPGDKGHDNSGASNLLTMMIPASSIQWGFEWLDDSSPDNSAVVMNHLLKNFNLSTAGGLYSDQGHASEKGEGAETESQSTVDMSKLWLEIGCSVVDAKIVQSNL